MIILKAVLSNSLTTMSHVHTRILQFNARDQPWEDRTRYNMKCSFLSLSMAYLAFTYVPWLIHDYTHTYTPTHNT